MDKQDLQSLNPRGSRRDVEFGAFAERSDGQVAALTVSNLSYDGCQLRSEEQFRPGEIVKLNLPRLGQVVAEIRWSGRGKTGATFITDEKH